MLSRFLGSPEEVVPQIVQTDSPSLQGADMAVAYFSLRAGGDFHDFARVSSTRLLFGLLDVAGKREDNRRILQAAQTCFRSAGEELFSVGEPNESDAMVELSRRLNLEIMRAAGGVRSCPAFAGCYNEELGTVCYVNAGHTPGLLRDDSNVLELPATGLPLGLFSLAPTDAHIVALGPQSSLAIVSRGVVEAECRNEEFGLAGVKNVMWASTRSAKELSLSILERVQDFMCAVPKHNDVTALTLTRGNQPYPRARRIGSRGDPGVK
ncbi:MAG TPA: SpoIIE family protein phosphatase [Terriglobales bacterium]|nr:SpoIIE family protein phosphatase [Terriglobales bacterium]